MNLTNSQRSLLRSALVLGLIALIGCGGAAVDTETEVVVEMAEEYSFECPALDGTTPLPDVRATIDAQEAALLKAALAGDQETLDNLFADEMSYVHENGKVSTKEEFFRDYLPKGYQEAVAVPREEMRQFCSTVTTVSVGHLRLNGEGEYPNTAVTHIWAKKGDRWVLVHRHESHKGDALGEQLTMEGGENNTDKVGAEPTPEVAKIIAANEAAWVKAMVDTDREVMEGLIGESLQYVHVTDHTSTRADFMKELMGGFTETDFKYTTTRQFGNTVINLHNAHYRHVNEPDQSRSQAMHMWVKTGDKWMLAGRHSARFEDY